MKLNKSLYDKMHHIIVKNFEIGDKVKLVENDIDYLLNGSPVKNAKRVLSDDKIYTIENISNNFGSIRIKNNKGLHSCHSADIFRKVEE